LLSLSAWKIFFKIVHKGYKKVQYFAGSKKMYESCVK
jgi:hypothetical protein